MNYPRSTRLADVIIINSESLRSEITQYLDVDPKKLRLIYEAVDHELFRPGDAAGGALGSLRTGSRNRSCSSCLHCGGTRIVTDCCEHRPHAVGAR